MIYILQIGSGNGNKNHSLCECSHYEFNNWKELEKFLVINMQGNPSEISIRIMDCFSRVSKDSRWIDPKYYGFDIILSATSSICFIIWNDEMITTIDTYNKISNPKLKKTFLREVRNMKIDSLRHDD